MPPPVGRRISGRKCVARYDLGKFLEIAKRRRRFRPAVKSQDRFAKLRNIFQQRLVQRHVERRVASAGIDEKPEIHEPQSNKETKFVERLIFVPLLLCCHFFIPVCGHKFWISQFSQSGLRAVQRRRPCQISQWLKIVHFCGTSGIRSCSIFSGVPAPTRGDGQARDVRVHDHAHIDRRHCRGRRSPSCGPPRPAGERLHRAGNLAAAVRRARRNRRECSSPWRGKSRRSSPLPRRRRLRCPGKILRSTIFLEQVRGHDIHPACQCIAPTGWWRSVIAADSKSSVRNARPDTFAGARR